MHDKLIIKLRKMTRHNHHVFNYVNHSQLTLPLLAFTIFQFFFHNPTHEVTLHYDQGMEKSPQSVCNCFTLCSNDRSSR